MGRHWLADDALVSAMHAWRFGHGQGPGELPGDGVDWGERAESLLDRLGDGEAAKLGVLTAYDLDADRQTSAIPAGTTAAGVPSRLAGRTGRISARVTIAPSRLAMSKSSGKAGCDQTGLSSTGYSWYYMLQRRARRAGQHAPSPSWPGPRRAGTRLRSRWTGGRPRP